MKRKPDDFLEVRGWYHPDIRSRRPPKPRKRQYEPFSTMLTPWSIEAVKAVAKRHPEYSESGVVRRLLKLGLMRYNETQLLPEVE